MEIMHASWNQSSIMNPQINTQEQSRVNQNPIACMTNNNLQFGIHKSMSLDFPAARALERGESGSQLLICELINCLTCSNWTHGFIKSASHEKSAATPTFMLSVLGLSETDVQGVISMHRDSQTQTGHGRGLLNAKDSICNVGYRNALLDQVRHDGDVILMTWCWWGTELFLSLYVYYLDCFSAIKKDQWATWKAPLFTCGSVSVKCGAVLCWHQT